MAKEISLRNVKVTRYIVPLREGGSLPALAEADDGFKYVLKFRGAGHGTKMLISELLGGMIASALGKNKASVQKTQAHGREIRVYSRSVGSVGILQQGVLAILFQAFAVNHTHRHLGTIRSGCPDPFGDVIILVKITSQNLLLFFDFLLVCIHIEIHHGGGSRHGVIGIP